MRRAPLLLVLLALCGCSAARQRELFAHRIDLLEDTLGDVAAPTSAAVGPTGTAVAVDLLAVGFEGDARHVLAAVVDALDEHPAVRLASMRYAGDEAAFGRRRRANAPAPFALRLACRFEGDAGWANPFIAFPGLFIFLPVWHGYEWHVAMTVEVRVDRQGGPPGRTATRTVEVAFRERNSRRSALFHLWPSTGTGGLQFLLAIALAPTFAFYDGEEETTPALVLALSPRLGRLFAQFVVDEVLAAQPRAPR